MYVGNWDTNINYRRGNIVFTDTKQYYICNCDHLSTHLGYPSKEDIYWIHISSSFLNNLITHHSDNKNTQSSGTNNTNNYNANTNTADFNDNSNDNSNDNTIDQTDTLSEYSYRIRSRPRLRIKINDRVKNPPEETNPLKRKLQAIETELENHKRSKTDNVTNLRDRLLLMEIDKDTKSFIVDKYDNTAKMSGSDYSKGMNWLRTVSKIPYGKYKGISVTCKDKPETIRKFFKKIHDRLDESIYGLDDVKQEILEFVARKITNPDSKGHVLALYSVAGTGKTKLVKTLAQALDLPFQQINFGGLNDVSILTGHSETYIGSKPGKIVEVLSEAKYMNPIIYLDEIDKISETKATEIFGTLTHVLDEEQNNRFQDNYFSNVNIDLSKVFFILAFNDITKVDKIVADRLKIIYINPPSLADKLIICQDKMIPDILRSTKLQKDIQFDREVIEYIITRTQTESGVRQLRKNIEKIVNRLNYDILIENSDVLKSEGDTIVITRTYVDTILIQPKQDTSYLSMYN